VSTTIRLTLVRGIGLIYKDWLVIIDDDDD
jgi:hypothetical protein